MINASDVASCTVLHRTGLTASGTGAAYRWFDRLFVDLGIVPDRFSAEGAGFPTGYIAFEKWRPHAENADFTRLESLSIVGLARGGESELSEWVLEASLSRRNRDGADLAINPDALGVPRDRAEDLGRQTARRIPPQYGYIFRQRMEFAPTCYAMGLGYGHVRDRRTDDQRMNISWWAHRYPIPVHIRLLRDVFPINFLSDGYLAAPIGLTTQTLGEWIEEEPRSRGVLTPLVVGLSEWRPPPERIPVIREALYRAGRVFYWRFFDPSEPLFRFDPLEPWVAGDDIPEIYRADFHSGREPDLIY